VNWTIQDEKRLDALADMNAGVALAQAGEIEQAAEYFARAVSDHPTSAEANYNLALVLSLQGKYSEAIPFYENTIQNQFDLIGAHFNLAVALEHTGKFEEALKQYELAVSHDSGDTEAKAAIRRLQQKSSNPPN
jgi:tetratricopeptide (TPR) repeat protein